MGRGAGAAATVTRALMNEKPVVPAMDQRQMTCLSKCFLCPAFSHPGLLVLAPLAEHRVAFSKTDLVSRYLTARHRTSAAP